MSKVNLSKKHPTLYQQVSGLSEAAENAAKISGLDSKLIELVKIRVSQINGCAYCLRLHHREALKQGETADRLAVLPAWWESQYFSEAERVALTLAEAVTQLTRPEQSIDINALTEEQVSAVSWVAIVTNLWNRIAIRSGYPVGS